MTTRGQLFNGEMVRAILAGRKTETRRPITKTNSHQVNFWSSQDGVGKNDDGFCGFADLDWDAHRVDCNPRPHGTPCTSRCSGREYCGTFVDGDARMGGEYLHVPGVGGETRQRVYAHVEPGDQLYVREAWALHFMFNDLSIKDARSEDPDCVFYLADGPEAGAFAVPHRVAGSVRTHIGGGCQAHQRGRGRPSIHMPKWAARINLRVTAVHAERIQDITNDGAKAEGIRCGTMESIQAYPQGTAERRRFSKLWNSIYAGRGQGWPDNAWCWVVKFEVMP